MVLPESVRPYIEEDYKTTPRNVIIVGVADFLRLVKEFGTGYVNVWDARWCPVYGQNEGQYRSNFMIGVPGDSLNILVFTEEPIRSKAESL